MQQGEIFERLDEGYFWEEMQERWVARDQILKSLATIWTRESLKDPLIRGLSP